MIVLVVIAIVMTILWVECHFGGSRCCQEPELVGDGKCDRNLMSQTICNYDNGDCCQMEKAGNGVCDDFNNFLTCENYDKGDCRPPSKTEWLNCPFNPDYIGDGICFEHFKTKAECNHDSGDCCDQSLLANGNCEGFNNFPTCENYDKGDCRPPNITDWPECPHNPKFIGDETCDEHLKNKAECHHDGEDCCDLSLIGNKFCNIENNIPTCNYYDGGDCPTPNITNWLDCPHNPKFIGDETCDYHLNHTAECNYDGSDCSK